LDVGIGGVLKKSGGEKITGQRGRTKDQRGAIGTTTK